MLFSLAAAFVFVFMLDLNTLLGQNVLINFSPAAIMRHG